MSTIHLQQTTTSTPEQYIAGLIDFGSFATFNDPDGDTCLFQEIASRLPGRGLSNLDVAMLTELWPEAVDHQGDYEPAPQRLWSGRYSAYIVARQDGKTPQETAKQGKLHIEGHSWPQ